MSLEKADAIVVRQVDFSESSRVITFFSREFGKFAALAKGARRLRGPFEAALDLLSECRVVFIRKSSGTLNLLTEARLNVRFRPQQDSPRDGLSRLYAGYYIAELLSSLTEDFDPFPELFDLTRTTLHLLSSAESCPSTLVIYFEFSLLQHIGLLPNLFECSVCGCPVEQTGKFAHWVSQGGLLCHSCRREEFAGTSVSAGSIEILRRLTESSPELAARTRLTSEQSEECHKLAVSAITHTLGRRPATLRYLQM